MWCRSSVCHFFHHDHEININLFVHVDSFPFKLINANVCVYLDALFPFYLDHTNFTCLCVYHEPFKLDPRHIPIIIIAYFCIVLFEETMSLSCFRHDTWIVTCMISILIPCIVWYHPPLWVTCPPFPWKCNILGLNSFIAFYAC